MAVAAHSEGEGVTAAGGGEILGAQPQRTAHVRTGKLFSARGEREHGAGGRACASPQPGGGIFTEREAAVEREQRFPHLLRRKVRLCLEAGGVAVSRAGHGHKVRPLSAPHVGRAFRGAGADGEKHSLDQLAVVGERQAVHGAGRFVKPGGVFRRPFPISAFHERGRHIFFTNGKIRRKVGALERRIGRSALLVPQAGIVRVGGDRLRLERFRLIGGRHLRRRAAPQEFQPAHLHNLAGGGVQNGKPVLFAFLRVERGGSRRFLLTGGSRCAKHGEERDYKEQKGKHGAFHSNPFHQLLLFRACFYKPSPFIIHQSRRFTCFFPISARIPRENAIDRRNSCKYCLPCIDFDNFMRYNNKTGPPLGPLHGLRRRPQGGKGEIE